MAKFNITVELEWINEEGGIDEAIKKEMIGGIVKNFEETICEEIKKTAEKRISARISEVIDQQVNNITNELLNKKFDVTDRWGEVKHSQTSVIDMLKSRLDDYLIEKVDKDGKTNVYNTNMTRLDYVIQKNIDYPMKKKIEVAAAEIKKGLEEYIDTTLKAQIGENVAKLIGLGQITSKIQKG